MRLRFLTSTPLDIGRGSGTYVGISVLARVLRELGHEVALETPRRRFPIYTAERLLFNRSLKPSAEFDCTVGFDMDGYRIAGATHVASLKGVIADEIRFERGLTRLTMGVQARCEGLHVHRAAQVLVTSQYCARQVRELYRISREPVVVPELIDLTHWRRLLAREAAAEAPSTVLYVGRLYRRKRVDLLLRAAAALSKHIPELRLRIVGNGPEAPGLHRLSVELRLEGVVAWLGDVSRSQLVEEYNRAAMFCLPSVQEGFGIVLLEAMAAGKPIVASRAASIPEVAPHAELVEPDNAEALAAAIENLLGSPELRARQAAAGREWVEQFDAPLVARQFLNAIYSAAARAATGTSA
jgi:glycosyltransferase involved in cell wall biosynthesis